MLAAAILVLVALVASVAIALLLRSWVRTESRLDARLHDPRTHTIAYAVPNGVDPVVFRVALDRAGFTSVVDRVADAEYLLVDCEETQRPRLRSVLESVHGDEFHGSAISLDHVIFEDER